MGLYALQYRKQTLIFKCFWSKGLIFADLLILSGIIFVVTKFYLLVLESILRELIHIHELSVKPVLSDLDLFSDFTIMCVYVYFCIYAILGSCKDELYCVCSFPHFTCISVCTLFIFFRKFYRKFVCSCGESLCS